MSTEIATHAHGDTHEGATHTHHEEYAARPHPEYVAIDIGEECGALIVHADPDLHGVEVEISPTGEDFERQHKEVLERQMGGRPAFTAVFDRITEGRYTLWIKDEARAREVAITGGEIAEVDWTTT
jgi:hypothetical protein